MNRYLKEISRLFQIRHSRPDRWIRQMEGKDQSSAIVSMSVLPSRFKGLLPTINSLTDQSVLPEKIVINLPRFFKRDKTDFEIPEYVENHPLIEINWIENDLGPATKLLPTIEFYEHNPDRLIVVVDDDQIYSREMVENYVRHEQQLPNAAMTLSGWTVPDSYNHADKEQRYGGIVRFYRKDTSVSEPIRVDCLQGAASFAVKPKFFDKKVFDFDSAPEEAFFVDDIWVSGNLARTKTPVYIIPAPFRFGRFVSVRQSTQFGLSSSVNADNTNNNTLYKYFKNQWWSMNS